MSRAPITTPESSSSNFQSIFNAALKDYEKKTKNDLLAHQLTTELKSCQSATAILAVLNKQCHLQEFIRSDTDGDGSKQWLNATLTVLCAFSDALGEGVSLVILW
jgi:ribosomal protein S8